MNNQTHVSEDEIQCDFSSIMDTPYMAAPNYTGEEPLRGIAMSDNYEQPKTFLEEYLEEHPEVVITEESFRNGVSRMIVGFMGQDNAKLVMQELKDRWAHVGKPTMPDPKSIVEDPVGDLIRHFGIFYEHVYLLEGYPKEAQPTLKELRLLGERIHRCLINPDGSLNTENVQRCEEAHMSVTLDGGFVQVVRGKAALRQKV